MSIHGETAGRAAAAAAPGFSFKKLFSDVLVYSSGTIMIKGMSLISLPIFTRILTQGDYGTWSVITSFVAFLTGILMLGGDSAYTRYYFQCKTDAEKKLLSSTWFLFLTAWSILVILLLLPFSTGITGLLVKDRQYQTALVLGLAGSPLLMLNLMFSQALRNQFKAREFTVLNIATAALTLVLSVGLVLAFGLGLNGALLGTALAALIMIPVRLWLIRDMLARRFDLPVLKKLLAFGIPLMPVSVAFWLFSNVDRLMVIHLISEEAVAVFSVAVSMTGVLMMLHTGLGQSWLPHAIKLYEEDREHARAVVSRTMNFFLAGAGVIVVGFIALSREVLLVLAPPEYHDAFWVIPFLALGFYFFISSQVTVVGIMVKNKTYYILITMWLLAGINAVLNYLFIPAWGIVGAGAATGLSYLFFAAGYAVMSRRLWPVPYNRPILLKLTAVTAAAVGLLAAIEYYGEQIWLNLALKLIVLLVAAALLFWIVGRHEQVDFREVLHSLSRQFKKLGRQGS